MNEGDSMGTARNNRSWRGAARSSGFSLIELLVVIVIIVILAGLVLAAVAGARRAALGSADASLARTLQTGVEQFRTDNGFLPPLVKDNLRASGTAEARPGELAPDLYTAARGGVFTDNTDWVEPRNGASPLVDNQSTRPNTFSFSLAETNDADRDYLRRANLGVVPIPGRNAEADLRFSTLSLSYYLIGVLPKDIDGVEGPGYRSPKRTGSFDLRGEAKPSAIDVASQADRLARNGDLGERTVLLDGNGVAVRYYRWLAGDPAAENETVVRDTGDLNVPLVVGNQSGSLDPTTNPIRWQQFDNAEIREAGYAIVLAGPDGLFGDPGTEASEDLLSATGDPDPGTDDEGWFAISQKVARDNTVVVGKP